MDRQTIARVILGLLVSGFLVLGCSSDPETNSSEEPNSWNLSDDADQAEPDGGGFELDADSGDLDLDSGAPDADAVDPDADAEDLDADSSGDDVENDIFSCDPQEVLQCAADGQLEVCNDEGDGVESQPCPDGTLCSEGACQSLCESDEGDSHLGCEFWSAFLPQTDEGPVLGGGPGELDYGVIVTNSHPWDATISLEVFASADLEDELFDDSEVVVEAGSAELIMMPQMRLRESGVTLSSTRLSSDLPVGVIQLNSAGSEPTSVDSARLFPSTLLGNEYVALSWPSALPVSIPGFETPMQRAFIAVIATEPGTTEVTVNSRARIDEGEEISTFGPDESEDFQLQQGEVLTLLVNPDDLGVSAADLTGSKIDSDRPVVVFAGHEQAVITASQSGDTCCADHLEEQLLPVDRWGTRFIAAPSAGREAAEQWKIVAAEDVTLETNPPQPGAESIALAAGDFVDFVSDEAFEVSADGKILAGQFLVGKQQSVEEIGDPSMVHITALEHFIDTHQVWTSPDYSQNFLIVTRPQGVEVVLNDVALSDDDFEAVDDSGFEVAQIGVVGGTHRVTSSSDIGVMVMGLGDAVSYTYAGGLRLE